MPISPRTPLLLPELLTANIQRLTTGNIPKLANLAVVLSTRYRENFLTKNEASFFINSGNDALAYAALRLPATYAQITGALKHLQELLPNWRPSSLLDLGSGPGTAIWAAKETFPELCDISALEKNKLFLDLAQQLFNESEIDPKFEQGDLQSTEFKQKAELVILANVLNELNSQALENALSLAWQSSTGVLLIIEPGVPEASRFLEKVAEHILSLGANIIAPYLPKQFFQSDYFLHFPQRFKRPEFQRAIKNRLRESNLPASDWEDAKYSYLAFSRFKVEGNILGRIVGEVKKHKLGWKFDHINSDSIASSVLTKKEFASLESELEWGSGIYSL